MSHSYLCDGCRHDCPRMLAASSPDFTYCFQRGVVQKIVVPDGYDGDPTRLCRHWKERQ